MRATLFPTEFDFSETEVIHQEMDYGPELARIEVTLYGKPLEEAVIHEIERQLPLFNLDKTELEIHQGYREEKDNSKEFQLMSNRIKLDIVEDLYKQNEAIIQSKDEKISLLESELVKHRLADYPVDDISQELQVHHEYLTEFALSNTVCKDLANDKVDTVCLAYVGFSKKPLKKELKEIEEWLKIRIKADSLRLIYF